METQESKRIVVVDDTQSVALILKNFLEDEGYNVSAHEDPKEALYDITVNGADFIITDFTMPGMNGVELLTAAQSSCEPSNSIIISADPDRVNQSSGKYFVIEKSTGFIQKIIATVHNRLDKKQH